MNQTQLADQLNVSEATISRLCAGERRPSFDLMVSIRGELGWSVESQVDALRESTSRYAVEFKARMERRMARSAERRRQPHGRPGS